MKRLRHILIALALAILDGKGAGACVPASGWPELVHVSPSSTALVMSKSATYVDLVVAEKLTPDFAFASLTRDEWAWTVNTPPSYFKTLDQALAVWRGSWSGSVRIHYRVLENLKAKSAPQFEISGRNLAIEPWLEHWQKPGLKSLKYHLDQQDLAAWPGHGFDCTAMVYARKGGLYLIFRDASGRLLRQPTPIRFKGEEFSLSGPAETPVTGASDPWVRLVRKTISRLGA